MTIGGSDEEVAMGGGTELVLASTSPRRRALLGLLGLPFEVVSVAVDETVGPEEGADRLARRLAAAKALAGAEGRPGRVVLAADTVVELGSRVLGKPSDAREARAMLRDLRGRPHPVVTGVAVAVAPPAGRAAAPDAGDGRTVDPSSVGRPCPPALRWHDAVATLVRMRPYRDDELERYVATGRPLDKAGAYAVQDAVFRPAAGVLGCYPNVVGLPLCAALRGLRAVGLNPSGPPGESLDPPCLLCERALPPQFRATGSPFEMGPSPS